MLVWETVSRVLLCFAMVCGSEEVHCVPVLDLILSRTLYFLAHMDRRNPNPKTSGFSPPISNFQFPQLCELYGSRLGRFLLSAWALERTLLLLRRRSE